MDSSELSLPHPRLTERRFVLVPLCELEPDLKIPGFDATVASALKACRDDGKLRVVKYAD